MKRILLRPLLTLSNMEWAELRLSCFQILNDVTGASSQETLHEATDVENQLFMTARLWCIADTAPYMHDGRAPTLTAAIDWHDGEVLEARTNYFALEQAEQEEVLEFLRSLHTPNHAACPSE